MIFNKKIVHVIKLELINYTKALQIQKIFSKKLIESGLENGQSTLLLLEHYPVYTIGIRSKQYSIQLEKDLLALGADFYRSDRGGLITFHGPGQLVAYPVMHLKQFNTTLKNYVCSLEEVLIKTVNIFNLNAYRNENVGVWVNDKKIAAIGIHASRFVTTHGIALNCNTNLNWFKHIVPCGLEGKGVTSLSMETNKLVTVNETIPYFLNEFSNQFRCEIKEINMKEIKEL